MWMVTLGRARAAIAGRAKIGARLQSARRQLAAGISSALGELAHSRRDIHHQPVPEARASRRVGIVAGDGKAFCANVPDHLRCGDLLPPVVRRTSALQTVAPDKAEANGRSR
jgi:hypothetical protein